VTWPPRRRVARFRVAAGNIMPADRHQVRTWSYDLIQ
jgi:hypothetical protein